ncbi:MAG TPA: RHS repeat-associated core domain-containing protein [Thermoanaerobaculia bacterium]|nr:RHS repeat-associated core domain-containing protein [Thermoanaerobaculia bacterium]
MATLSLSLARPAEAAIEISANQKGRLTSMGNGDTRIFYEYDALGRATATQYAQDGLARVFLMQYGYPQNPANTAGIGTVIVKETFPDGEEVSYTHDASGQVVAIRSIIGAVGEDVLRDVRLNARGRVTRIDLGNQTSTTYTYDDAGHLRLTASRTVDKGGQIIQDYGYDYDENGNVTLNADGVRPDQSFTLQYDSLDQLIAMRNMQGGVLEEYVYDSVGNLTRKGSIVQNYNAGGRPHALADSAAIPYQYDANGNAVAIGSSVVLDWNAENLSRKITAGALVTEKWHLGEVLWKKVVAGTTTYYLPAMRIENGAARKYYGTYAERAEPPAGDHQLRFYHADHLGSSSVMTDKDGTVIRRASYWPWGQDRGVDGTFTPKLQFNFKEKEEGTGFYDYGARLYNPATGRWLSADKYLLDGLNRYAYVRNNPWTRIDPTGNFSSWIHKYILSRIFPHMNKRMLDMIVRGSAAVDGLTKDNPRPDTMDESQAHLHGMLSKRLLDSVGGDRQKAIEIATLLRDIYITEKKGIIAVRVAEYKQAVEDGRAKDAAAALDKANFAFGQISHLITDPKSKQHSNWTEYDASKMYGGVMDHGQQIIFGCDMLVHKMGEDDIDEIPADVWTETSPELRRMYVDLIARPAGIDPGFSPAWTARPKP